MIGPPNSRLRWGLVRIRNGYSRRGVWSEWSLIRSRRIPNAYKGGGNTERIKRSPLKISGGKLVKSWGEKRNSETNNTH